MAQAFFGGVHPNDMKAATNEKAIEQLAPPAEVVIPMSMHFGAPAFLGRCDELWAFGPVISSGMQEEIAAAERLRIPVWRMDVEGEMVLAKSPGMVL